MTERLFSATGAFALREGRLSSRLTKDNRDKRGKWWDSSACERPAKRRKRRFDPGKKMYSEGKPPPPFFKDEKEK